MPQKLRSSLILRFRKILFLTYLIGLILPILALYLANTTENYNQYGWWLASTLIVLTGIDQLLGRESSNPSDDQLKLQEKSIYYSNLVFVGLPAVTVLSFYSAYFFSKTNELNWAGRIGWIISLGLTISFLAFAAGHELIHREKPIDRLIGGFLFAFVFNAVYIIEHICGHHFNVATPDDSGSAHLNQSFYHFFQRAVKKAFVNAWQLEKKRLNRKGNSVLSWRNKLISWHLVSLCIAIVYYFFFGLLGIIFFIGQGLIALTVHNMINYIQHYGLKRRKLDDNQYEKFCASHAWSCNYQFSNIASFHFPHHADHHLNPRRPYQFLRHLEKSPQMPFGYFGMFFMTLVPPLWFKVMNLRILAYNKEAKIQKQTDDKFERKNQPTSPHLLINKKCKN